MKHLLALILIVLNVACAKGTKSEDFKSQWREYEGQCEERFTYLGWNVIRLEDGSEMRAREYTCKNPQGQTCVGMFLDNDSFYNESCF